MPTFFLVYLTQGQIDGNVVKASFTLAPRQKVSPPPKPVSSAPKRDASKSDNTGAEIEKDGPRRPRESNYILNFRYLLLLVVNDLYCVNDYHNYVLSISATENSSFSKKEITST